MAFGSYVSVSMLLNAPTGAPWDIVPQPGSTGTAAQIAETTNILYRASSRADAIANQPLRSTLDTEVLQGPDYRLTVDASGVGRFMTSRWPVTQVVAGRVSPRASIPRSWTSIPVQAMDLEDPPMTALSPVVEGAAGAGGNAVLIAPGYMSQGRRNAYTCEVAYLNGWPHAALTDLAEEGAETITVDNVTGFASAAAFMYDGAGTETVLAETATAATPVSLPWGATGTPVTVQAGPGTLTLSSPLAYEHQPGTIVSALPQDIAWAVIMLATAQVLAEGATAVAIPDIAGSLTSGGKGVGDLIKDAKEILSAYKRVI